MKAWDARSRAQTLPLQMSRQRHLDPEAIRKSLLTECPGCRYLIPPAELSRASHEFIVPQKATRMKTN